MSQVEQQDCPDGGRCHHGCVPRECFRVRACGPLSGVYPGNRWPGEIVAENQEQHIERPTRAADLRVGDVIKSFVDFIPHMTVTHAPRPGQYGMVDWMDTFGPHHQRADFEVTVLVLAPPEPGWGEHYAGTTPDYRTPQGPVWMFRRGQRVRFYAADGTQVGPEQPNVAPAVAYAFSQGWASI